MMNVSGRQRVIPFAAIVVFVMCAIAAFIIIVNAPPKYDTIFLLPLIFGFLSLIFLDVYQKMAKSITIAIFVSLMAVKNILTPLCMALSNGQFRAMVNTEDYMLYAVLLQIYETIAIFVVLHRKSTKIGAAVQERYVGCFDFNKKYIKTFRVFTLLLTIIVFGVVIRYPKLLAYISVGISGDKTTNIQNTILRSEMRSTVPSMIYYLYSYCLNLLRWAFPISVIFSLYASKKGNERIKLLISFVSVIISAAITTDTVAVSLFIFLSLSFVLSRLYPSKSRLIIRASIFLVIGIGVLWISLKSFGNERMGHTTMDDVAQLLQAYFSGPENVAVALAIDSPFGLNEAIGNIFKFIPYIMYFFKEFISSNSLFNYTFWGRSGIESQIIPMISQGARCFSVVLAPLFTVIISNIAISSEIKAYQKNTLFDFTIFTIMGICFSIATFMYSASLCIQLFFNYIFPIKIFAWISNKTSIGSN